MGNSHLKWHIGKKQPGYRMDEEGSVHSFSQGLGLKTVKFIG